jgi:hypothetical protein
MGLLSINELGALGQQPPGATVVTTRLTTPGEHLESLKRRVRSIFYSQPRAWRIGPGGRRLPLLRVGAGWSRARYEQEAREAQGRSFARQQKFVKDFKSALFYGEDSPSFQSFVRRNRRSRPAIDRMLRARRLTRERGIRLQRERERRAALAQVQAEARARREREETKRFLARTQPRGVLRSTPWTPSYRMPVRRGLIATRGPATTPVLYAAR